MPLEPGTRLGVYEILMPLGVGGMGEVYRARDTKLNRDVALKILPAALAADPGARTRFEREAQAVAALSHPNILGIFDVGIEHEVPFAVMELLDGATLREQLHDGAVGPRKALGYAQQMAAGLSAAHARGITHRDLKPENIFVTRDGQIKILDFGLAKIGPSVPASGPSMLATSPALTGAGTIVGTVGYMSPEQVRGRDVDHRSDIFSFGAILYELLSGHRAFTGDSAVETMNAILKEDPPELTRANAALPPALDRIVRRCLEKNPEERFQSARDVAFALEAVSTTRSDASMTGVQDEGASRSKARRAIAITVAVTALAAASALSFAIGARRSAPSSARLTRLTFDRGTVRSARFAPDGKTIVYGAAWHGQPIRMYQTRLGSPESIPLQLPNADVLAIAPSGELAIALNRRFKNSTSSSTLARAPLVGGSPREVLEAISDADWAPKGDELAVVRRINGKDRLEYPVGQVLSETTGYFSHPRVAPSGGAIAYLDHPVYGDNRGWVSLVTTGGETKHLTKEWGWTQGLAWSADGREIWYAGADGGRCALRGVTREGVDREIWSAPSDLTILDVSPDGRALMTANSTYTDVRWQGPGESEERDISWFAWSNAQDVSSDGHAVLFTRYDEGAGLDYQVGLRRIDAAGAVLLGTGQAARLSPDGKWALAITYSTPGLFALPTGTGERRTLTTPGFTYSTGGWFPDGRRILFIAQHEREPPAVYMQDLEGGGPRKVASRIPQLAGELGTTVSPDSKWFFGAQVIGSPVIVPIEGGEPCTLANLTENDVLKAWTPDGHGLIVARWTPDRSGATIARLDLETSRLDPMKTIRLADPSGLSGAALLVTPDGRTVVYSVIRFLTDLYLVEGLK